MHFKVQFMNDETFIFCLEGVLNIDTNTITKVVKNLEKLAIEDNITSIYKTCDSIEGLEESLNNLLYDDHNFKDYEIIYLVMLGEGNNICLNQYYYTLEEIAELFEGKMRGKILHFSNAKTLELSQEEAQYFLDITGALAVSGYGTSYKNINSISIDIAFFKLLQEQDNIVKIVETLYQKNNELCKLLDFRLYY
ncbi:conserved hypothetical protein [Flavobacterium psychrophilum]|nr:Hypothetical protein FPSM_01391 [Flavobacterium psychrophilum]SNA72766.1 conserved hypothetical protein [Flavobacterium psychrophilum]SNB01845.1 conserved hypothetical protein [Flavobacterium psychrophilum]SNB96514.1 conserved hypothetical protein [Flavobacterium psychrophilum]